MSAVTFTSVSAAKFLAVFSVTFSTHIQHASASPTKFTSEIPALAKRVAGVKAHLTAQYHKGLYSIDVAFGQNPTTYPCMLDTGSSDM